MTTTSCPTDTALLLFLEDARATEDLTAHINTCERCQSRLDELAACRASAHELVDKLGGRAVDDATHIAQVLDHIKVAGEAASKEDFALPPGLLAPSNYPGALGRLGQYEMLQLLGRGGMGAVFKAFDPSLHRVVAIKLLAPHLAHNQQARKRFIREAQAAAAVSHDHVVTTYAIDETAEQPAIVMQYVSGRSLHQKLDAEGPLELKEILRIGFQTAAGLAAAHAQGLVHRDVKPANILLENGVQRVKLTDFGLARAVDDVGLTVSGVIAGTPEYMAPEQAQGETITPRADLFSLGSVLYAMCTGKSPFRASTTMGILKNVCDATPRPIRDLNPEIPDWLCTIIDRLLAKDPAQRFTGAKEVAELLEQWLAHVQRPLAVPSPAPLSPLPASVESSTTHSTDVAPPASDSTENEDEESPVDLGRTPEERQLLQRAVGYVELASFALMGVGGFSLVALWVMMDWQALQLWGGVIPARDLGLLSGPRDLFRAGGPLLQSAVFIVMIVAGSCLHRLQSRTLVIVGAVLSNMTATLQVPGVLGTAVGIWVLMTCLRSEVIEAFHLAAELRRLKREREAGRRLSPQAVTPSASEPTVLDIAATAQRDAEIAAARDRLRGAAWGLMILGGVSLLLILGVYIAMVYSMGVELLGARPAPWSVPILKILLPLLTFGMGFVAMVIGGRRMTTLQGFSTSVMGCVLAMLLLPANAIGLPLGIWGIVLLRRREVRDAYAAQRGLESSSPNSSGTLALLRERLREPAVALMLAGLLNWLLLVVLAMITLQSKLQQEYAFQRLIVPQFPLLIALALIFAVTSTVMIIAGLRMLSLRSYPLVLSGAGCAAVSIPGLLVGLPVAVWVLMSLIQPEVRAAFATVGLTPHLRHRGRRWQPWHHPQFSIVFGCVAVSLCFVHQGGLNLSDLWPPRTRTNQLASDEEASPQPLPRFTFSRPDQMLPIGRTDSRQMAVSAGGALVAVAGGSEREGFLKIWNAQTLQELALQTSPHVIHCLAFGDHGRVLATGEADGKVRLRDGRTGVVQWEISAHSTPVTAVSFCEGSYGLISGGEDGTLRLWEDRKSIQVDFLGMSAAITDVATTRDGARIAAASRDQFVQLWDAKGMPISQVSYPAIPLRITLDEVDGQLGVAFENGDCHVMSLKDRRIIGRWSLSGHSPTGLRTAFWKHPKTAIFITASDGGSIQLHNFTEFRQLVTLLTSSPSLGADLVAGLDRIISAHVDGRLRVWNLNRR